MLWLLLCFFVMAALVCATDNHLSFRAHGSPQGVYLLAHLNLAGGSVRKEYVFSYDFAEKQGRNTLWQLFFGEKRAKRDSGHDLSAIFEKCRVKTNLYLAFGTGEPVSSAFLWALLQALIFAGSQWLQNRFPQQSQRLILRPVWGKASFFLDFNCMISIKTGKLLLAVLQMAVHAFWEAAAKWYRALMQSCRPLWKTFYK